MRRVLTTALVAAAFSFGTIAAPALAQTDSPRAAATKQHAKKRIVREPQDGRKIACTPAGCAPIPRNCYPTPGMRWDGDPSGFDVIVCR